MGTKFKDKITGFIAEFEYPVDIETTRSNPAYEEVFNEDVCDYTTSEIKAYERHNSPKGTSVRCVMK